MVESSNFVLFVSEKQDGNGVFSRLNDYLLKHVSDLVHLVHICAVHDENNAVDRLVVVLPRPVVLLLARQVPHLNVHVVYLELLGAHSYGRDCLCHLISGCSILHKLGTSLHFLYDCCFARGLEADNLYLELELLRAVK